MTGPSYVVRDGDEDISVELPPSGGQVELIILDWFSF